MATETAAQLQARADKFVADRHNHLNAKQQTSLGKLLKRVAAARKAEATALGVPPIEASAFVDVGPTPLPNNSRGQTEGQFYDCPDDIASFEEKYGYTVQFAFDDNLTKMLRPDPHAHDHITDATVRAQAIAHDATQQAIALAWTKGEIPFEQYASVLGGNSKWFGCIVIADIHDLGVS